MKLRITNTEIKDIEFLRPDDISLDFIAEGLCNMVRWAGHAGNTYSVAAHSLIVAHICPPEFKLHALLHDAAEAYIGDIPAPLKKEFPQLEELEAYILELIFKRAGLGVPPFPTVLEADFKVREAEEAYFFTGEECNKELREQINHYNRVHVAPADFKYAIYRAWWR